MCPYCFGPNSPFCDDVARREREAHEKEIMEKLLEAMKESSKPRIVSYKKPGAEKN